MADNYEGWEKYRIGEKFKLTFIGHAKPHAYEVELRGFINPHIPEFNVCLIVDGRRETIYSQKKWKFMTICFMSKE